MSPPPDVAPPPAETAEKRTKTLREERVAPRARAGLAGPAAPRRTHAPRAWFEDALLEMSSTSPKRRTADFVFSLVVHFLVLAALLLLPLYFTEAIDLKQFAQTLLVAPPPPPPPPPPAAAMIKASAPRRVFTPSGKLVAPARIPERVAMLREEDLPPELGGVGVAGGVPGGVPGGQAGGVIGGIIGGIPGASQLPPPPKAVPKAPIRVGGRVKAPRPVSTPQPLYPALARAARLQGDVVVDAVIDVSGSVVEMKVVSGHPLLITAALDALRRWKYEPTYLNEEPVPVALLVTIRFRLD